MNKLLHSLAETSYPKSNNISNLILLFLEIKPINQIQYVNLLSKTLQKRIYVYNILSYIQYNL